MITSSERKPCTACEKYSLHACDGCRAGQHNPLDGYTWNSSGPVGVKEYYIKVVPVTYTNVKGVQLSSNQYSVTEHFKHAYDGFPAVFVMCAAPYSDAPPS